MSLIRNGNRRHVEIVKPSLLSYDHYQFATDGDRAGYFLNLALIRRAALGAGVPFLFSRSNRHHGAEY